MWCCLHFRSTCSQVFGSSELHIEHIIQGKTSITKNNCFLTFPIYWPCCSFKKHVFCESIMFLLVQKSLDRSLSISSLAIHLSILGNSVATTSRLFFYHILLCIFLEIVWSLYQEFLA